MPREEMPLFREAKWHLFEGEKSRPRRRTGPEVLPNRVSFRGPTNNYDQYGDWNCYPFSLHYSAIPLQARIALFDKPTWTVFFMTLKSVAKCPLSATLTQRVIEYVMSLR